MNVIRDHYGRSFSYLRLSVTDACNFRCQYCLPNGYQRQPPRGDIATENLLSLPEIENLVGAFAELGFNKVRLTGGEPTLRPDIVEIVRRVSAVPGITTVALTTNGYRLDSIANSLSDAGLTALNISLDSLSPDRFQVITGSKNFERVLNGVFAAQRAGIKTIKLNVVLLRSFIDQDLPHFIDFVRTHKISVRFIELMQTGENAEFFEREHLSGDQFCSQIQNLGWQEIARVMSAGPAREFRHPDFIGTLGIIAPYSRDFCGNCNRLRISSRGQLKLCLFGDGEISLRHLMQCPTQRPQLIKTLQELIGVKAASHRLHEGVFGSTQNLSTIGG